MHVANMAFHAYMLRCADGRFYTGHTDTLERRIAEHQTGGFCDFTSRRRPVELVWSESFPTRIEALEAERIVGGWSRAKKAALIAGDWKTVSLFARPPRERFSTSLETNGGGRPAMIGEGNSSTTSAPVSSNASTPFVSSEGEKPSRPTR